MYACMYTYIYSNSGLRLPRPAWPDALRKCSSFLSIIRRGFSVSVFVSLSVHLDLSLSPLPLLFLVLVSFCVGFVCFSLSRAMCACLCMWLLTIPLDLDDSALSSGDLGLGEQSEAPWGMRSPELQSVLRGAQKTHREQLQDRLKAVTKSQCSRFETTVGSKKLQHGGRMFDACFPCFFGLGLEDGHVPIFWLLP